MYQTITRITSILLTTIIFISCSNKDDYESIPIVEEPDPEETHLNIDLTSVPFAKLSDYKFFKDDIKDQSPAKGVLPFDLNSHLFTDYALKKRFIWMPEGVKASYESDHDILNFPDGTILIKTFFYDNTTPDNTTRLIETRLLIKKQNEWIFATYEWNEDQTDAVIITNGAEKNISWIDLNNEEQNITYQIPTNSECLVCHKNLEIAKPIGPKPQNLNKMYPYSEGNKNQLQKWVEIGYLDSNYPADITSTVDWTNENIDIELRVRSYLDINCAHCHFENGHCSYRDLKFAFHETINPYNMGICTPQGEVISDAYTYIINPGNSNRSSLAARLNSVVPNEMMPMIGRTIVHREAVTLIENYINSLQTICN